MLEYKIVEKEQFTVMGVSRKFNSETSYQKIPEFWQEQREWENRMWNVWDMHGR